MGTDEISKDLSQIDNSIWYVCKYCRRAYQHKHQLIEHKKTKHYEQLLQASNEKKLAKKKQEEKNGNQSSPEEAEGVVAVTDTSSTVTSSATSPSDEQTDLGMGIPIPVPVEATPDVDINLGKELELSSPDLSTSALELDDVPIPQGEGIDDKLVLQSSTATANFDSADETNALENMMIDPLDDLPSFDLQFSDDQAHSECAELLASAAATLSNTIPGNGCNRDDESDSEIECVFDSHRPLGSPMKPLSPTPVASAATAIAVRTWNMKDFKGACAKFLPPPVPISKGSETEQRNVQNERENSTNAAMSTAMDSSETGAKSKTTPMKRKFLSLSSSADYQHLDSTKEVIAKLEVLGEHKYCPRCFKMFRRPSSYKAHRRICHFKTVASFREFKSKFQIEVLPCVHTQQQQQQQQQQNYSGPPKPCRCQKKNCVSDHVLVKIPAESDHVNVSPNANATVNKREHQEQETPSPNKIRKISLASLLQPNGSATGSSKSELDTEKPSQQPQLQYTCKLCGSSFELKYELTSHLLVHMSSSPDPKITKKPAPDQSQSQKMTPPATNSKPKPTSTSSSSQHEIIIARPKSRVSNYKKREMTTKFPLRYRICNRYRSRKAYSTSRGNLKGQLKSKIFYRFHTRGKSFSCPICPSSFKSKAEFCLHSKIHRRSGDRARDETGNARNPTLLKKGGKNFTNYRLQDESSICKLCFKTFYKFEGLIQHLRNHRFSPVPMDHE